ncbi:MAG: hypothetical protein K2X77_09820 [Candidatus Obscuribacterales bacterium]|nr:hypothetical protein [Candidatus Obscuribacterales bacterium]
MSDKPANTDEKIEKRDEIAEKKDEPSNLQKEGWDRDQAAEVKRVADSQAEKQKSPAEVYQTVFGELAAAKKGMLAVNDVIAKGAGPYSDAQGLKVYSDTLKDAIGHYMKAQREADKFLWQTDAQGRPITDRSGRPVPSEANVALTAQRDQLEKDAKTLEEQTKSLQGEQKAAANKKLMETLEQRNMIDDLLRSSGYARANHALALMFDSANLKPQDKLNRRFAVDMLLSDAANFDPNMKNDANFRKHLYEANAAMLGVPLANRPTDVTPNPQKPADQQTGPPADGGQKPGDQKPVDQNPTNPGDKPVDPAKPGDQTQKPADQTQKPADQTQKPADQTQKPTDAVEGPNGSKIEKHDNNYHINFQGVRVPTWMPNRPDGTATPAFKYETQDGQGKPVAFERNDGKLKTVVQDNKELGMDGKPLYDERFVSPENPKGIRRLDEAGVPVMAMKDATDPRTMSARAVREAGDPPKLDDKTRDQFKKSIESADTLDRVAIVQAMNKNQEIYQDPKNAEGVVWDKAYSEKLATQNALAADLGKARSALKPEQVNALKAIWNRKEGSIDEFLGKAENAEHKKALEADAQKWTELKDKLQKVDQLGAEIGSLLKELKSKPELAKQVNNIREAVASNNELKSIYLSSVEARAGYLNALISQENVKKFRELPGDQKASSPLKDDINVKEAQRIAMEMAKTSDNNRAQLTGLLSELNLNAKDVTPVQTDKVADKPADKPAEQPAATELTKDQMESVSKVLDSYKQYMNRTENGTKPLSKEEWEKVAGPWEKALGDYAAAQGFVAAFDKETQTNFEKQLLYSLAMEKAKKTDVQQLEPKDLDAVKPEEIMAAGNAALTRFAEVSQQHIAALKALPEDKQNAYKALEEQFGKDAARVQEENKNDQAKALAELQKLEAAKVAEQKKLSPEVAAALDAVSAAMQDQKVVFAKIYSERKEATKPYNHFDELRIQYAQALAVQGGDENLAKAKAIVTEAIKNPEAEKMVATSSDGHELLKKLGVESKLATEILSKQNEAQAKQDKLFPEIKLLKEAQELAKDPNKWAEANAKFKEAADAIDAEIKERGGLDAVRTNINGMEANLRMSLDAFVKGSRSIPGGETAEGKQLEEQLRTFAKQIMDQDVQGVPGKKAGLDGLMNALRGGNGDQIQSVLAKALTAGDRETMQNMLILEDKQSNVSNIRLAHAIAASEYGHKKNDKAAKESSIAILESIAQVDPASFKGNPNILGALKQAKDGKQMDLTEGKARAMAFSDAKEKTIAATQTGLVDQFILSGVSPMVNGASKSIFGGYPSDVPYIGGIISAPFGGGKEADEKILNQSMMMQLQNAEVAKQERDRIEAQGNSAIRNLLGDVGGVATTFGTAYGTKLLLNGINATASLDPRLKFGVSALTGLAAGSVTNNAIRGDDLLSYKGAIRNTAGSVLLYGAVSTFRALPTQQTMSEATLSKLGTEFAVPNGLTGKTAQAISGELTSAAGKSGMMEALKYRINPLSYTPLQVTTQAGGSWLKPWTKFAVNNVGWGGEKTAELLASRTMSLAEWQARRAGAQFVGTMAAGTMFGSGFQAAKIAAGERVDGKDYSNPMTWVKESGTAGLQVGFASAFTIPLAGSFLRPVGLGRVENFVGNQTANLFSKIPGVTAEAVPKMVAATGTGALFLTQPSMKSFETWGNSRIYVNTYDDAAKRLLEMKAKTKAELEAKNKPQQQPAEAQKPAEQTAQPPADQTAKPAEQPAKPKDQPAKSPASQAAAQTEKIENKYD